MIREPPWLEPWSCAGVNFSRPEHPLAPGGQVVGGGAAHPAEPDDDDVVSPWSLRTS